MKTMSFHHPSLDQQQHKPLIYTAHSKHLFYFTAHISKFVLEADAVPLNPFMLFDYFLVDSVARDTVRSANNSVVARADEVWVFGPVSNGVLAEIVLAKKQGKPLRYFTIEESKHIVEVPLTAVVMEEEVADQKHLLLALPQEKEQTEHRTIHDAQQEVKAWTHTIGVRPFSPLTNMGVLTEEVGEVARLLIRIHGDQSFKHGEDADDLGDELADVLFSLLCIANQNNIHLSEAFEKNMQKKTHRDATRHRDNPKLSS